jgi:hypothetical protein
MLFRWVTDTDSQNSATDPSFLFRNVGVITFLELDNTVMCWVHARRESWVLVRIIGFISTLVTISITHTQIQEIQRYR